MPIRVYIRAEGYPDIRATLKLCQLVGITIDLQLATYTGGYVKLDSQLPKCNAAAKLGTPFIVLRDLDQVTCPPELIDTVLSGHSPNPLLLLRIPVRALEAWLMADRTRFAAFMGVSVDRVPSEPESIVSPKKKVIELARKSRYTSIQQRMVPLHPSDRQGPEYPSALGEFVDREWEPLAAAKRSPSLADSIDRFRAFARIVA